MNKSNTILGSRWEPTPELNTHAGKRQPMDADFFMPPPPEIGDLVSAGTTLARSAKLLSKKNLLSIIGSLGIVVMLGTWWAFGEFKGFPMDSIMLSAMSAFGLMVGAWYLVSDKISKNYCSYVGEKGLAEYELTGDRTSRPKESLLMFVDTSFLYISTTDWYGSGFYMNTSYIYTWKSNTSCNFQTSGNYRIKKNVALPENDRWYFANMSEVAWTNYLLSTIDAQIAQNGYVEFVMLFKDDLESIRIGHGFLEFVSKKYGSQQVMRSEIQNISLDSGKFQFKHKDPLWSAQKGSLIFDYDLIPNSFVFKKCLKECLNIECR